MHALKTKLNEPYTNNFDQRRNTIHIMLSNTGYDEI